MMFNPENVDDISFTAKMGEIIVSWPLYRTCEFRGPVTIEHVKLASQGLPYVPLPEELTIDCGGTECRKAQKWSLAEPYIAELKAGGIYEYQLVDSFVKLVYRCNNCRTARRVYFLSLALLSHQHIGVTKVGQMPPLERSPEPTVASVLDSSDLRLYRNALTCRNSNFGIGAVAYLRRIVENRTNDVLDLAADRLRAELPDSPLISELEDIKTEKRFSAKLEFAEKLLPPSVKRGGHNPVGALHELTSEGLHGKSDDECVDVFDRCQLAFEHVIKRLKEDKDEDERYDTALRLLQQKQTKKKTQS